MFKHTSLATGFLLLTLAGGSLLAQAAKAPAQAAKAPAQAARPAAAQAARPAAAQAAKPASPDPWYGRTTKAQFQPIKVAGLTFQMEWPRKDWMLLPSAGTLSLVMASKKGDALVVVERSALRQPLDPSDITDLFAQLESDAIKEKQKAIDVQARVIDAGTARLVAVQYQRTGTLGIERVRQYSVPAGNSLYRVTCISAAAQFLAYDPLFAHMAATFAATPE